MGNWWASTTSNSARAFGWTCLAALCVSGPAAADFDVEDGQTATTTQTLGDNETGTVRPAGAIVTTGVGDPGIAAQNSNTILNQGQISASGDFGDGILAFSQNTITNEGAISVIGANAFGILALDGNTIVNSGSITTGTLALSGISVFDGNTITNDGTIITFGDFSFAIDVFDDNIISNAGSISTSGDFATAIDGLDGNTIHNTGDIATTGFSASGIDVLDGNAITNDGSIQTSGDGSVGILVEDDNTIDSNGSILTFGDGAPGIVANDFNTIVVHGSITTHGEDSDGLFIDDDSTVTNFGTISTSGFDSDGIEVDDRSTVINWGVVTTSGGSSADAIELDDNSTLFNAGTLIATGSVLANGIDGEDNATIVNSGTVQSALGAGIDLTADTTGSSVTNSGLISGGSGISIDFGAGNDSLSLSNGSVLDGVVDFDAGDAALFFQTGNHTITSTGTTPVVTSEPDIFFVQSGDTVTSLDQDLLGFSELNQAAFDHAFQIGEALSHQLNWQDDVDTASASPVRVASAASASGAPFAGIDGNRVSMWLSAYGGISEWRADSPVPDAEHTFWGALAGATFAATSEVRVGAFAGYGASDVDSNFDHTHADVSRYFAGIFATAAHGRWAASGQLFGGAGRTDSERTISNNTASGGLERATGEMDSTFVALGAEIARQRAISDQLWAFVPSVSIGYVGEWYSDYAETGAFASLVVEERALHGPFGRALLAWSAARDRTSVKFGIGAEGRHVLGDDSVGVQLLATPFTATPDDRDAGVDALLQLGILHALTRDVHLYLDLEGRSGTVSKVGGTAQGGVNVRF